MGKWVVYLITNESNGKGYVGITNERHKTIYDRLEDHIKMASDGGRRSPNGRLYPIHAAIRKYGEENFSVKVLENKYFDLEDAQELETYYIKKLNTYASGSARGGYNLTFGGEEPDWDPDLDDWGGKRD